jgi:eukaryotic-like serine/threonine-protein kinase
VQLGEMRLNQGKFAEAEEPLRACLDWRVRAQPDNWSTANARSLLGQALRGQKKFAAAEQLLLEGYAQMKQREAQLPPGAYLRLVEAAHRLVDLYEACQQSEKAAHWQEIERVERAFAVAKLCVGIRL